MSDQMIEQKEVGRRLIPELPPIPAPKKITEQHIKRAVEDVIKETQEKRLSPTANAVVELADAVVTESLRKTLPEKSETRIKIVRTKSCFYSIDSFFSGFLWLREYRKAIQRFSF